MMYVPKGFAHGFLTLQAYTELLYFVSASYAPHYERGIRWDDPAFNIDWPERPQCISERDLQHPDYQLPAGDIS
jgi:dTDP-4-dehydrorhamnose 3,5-epimerase